MFSFPTVRNQHVDYLFRSCFCHLQNIAHLKYTVCQIEMEMGCWSRRSTFGVFIFTALILVCHRCKYNFILEDKGL